MLALAAAVTASGEAEAHRLDAACKVLPQRMVRVESWFDNGETPKTGQVEVTGPDGVVLVKGRLSSQGLFLFDAPEGQPLKVVVEAGEGHRAEAVIKPEDLLIAQAAEDRSRPQESAAPPSHESPSRVKDVLIGIGLLVAVAALALGWRNARTIRELRRQARPPV
jgi:nickel transport protein